MTTKEAVLDTTVLKLSALRFAKSIIAYLVSVVVLVAIDGIFNVALPYIESPENLQSIGFATLPAALIASVALALNKMYREASALKVRQFVEEKVDELLD